MPFNPLDPAVLADPYPHYRRLQADDPIHWGNADDMGLPGRWYVTRLDDVVAVLKDNRFGREIDRVRPDLAATIPPEEREIAALAQGWMILRDPPVHARLRGLPQRRFTPRAVGGLREEIEAWAAHLIRAMIQAGPPLDLLSAYALPLTVGVTARSLGLPLDDLPRLAEWSRTLATLIDLNQSEETRADSRRAVIELLDYLREIVAERRRQPAEDLLSDLARMDDLGEDELMGTLTHLIFVGNDPVMHLIGNGVYHLLRRPAHLDQLRRRPEQSEAAVDELMRFDSPVQMTFRYVLEDVTLHGKEMRTGDHVAAVLGAANRDPAHHPQPDVLDFARPQGQLMHFGQGIHYCLGAPLARIEGQIGILSLLEALPDLALIEDQPSWQRTAAVRGLTHLPVRF
ncbi:MAG: cytochrome P450 [Caldilineaceae bacterium]|nr:cytochrome P450 [Caldilineaceae bacterium]